MRNRTSQPWARLRSKETTNSKHVFQRARPSFFLASIQTLALALLLTGFTSRGIAQAGTSETVIQKATEQFESSPLKTTSLGDGLFLFSGDGGNVTAVVDDGSTLLIDSGIDSRITELGEAIHQATMRPVTRLVRRIGILTTSEAMCTSAPKASPSSRKRT